MIGKQIVRQPPLTNPIDVLLADVAIRVQLNRTDYKKVIDRYETINRWIEREDSPLKDRVELFYPQGSMAIGATIASKLRTDEFDIDVAAQLDLPETVTPQEALDVLYEAIRGEPDSRYYRMAKRRTRCVTVDYSDDMHVDVTPMLRRRGMPERESWIFHHRAEAPLEPSGRLIANPYGFAEWFKDNTPIDYDFADVYEKRSLEYERMALAERADTEPVPLQEPPFRKSMAVITLQLLKRWRNVQYDARPRRRPPSIMIAKLVADGANRMGSLSAALMYQAQRMLSEFERWHSVGQLIHIANPACPADVFTDRWPRSLDEQEILVDDLRTLVAKVKRLVAGCELDEMQRIMVELFGEKPTADAFRAFNQRLGDDIRYGRSQHLHGTGQLVVPTVVAGGSVAAPPSARSTPRHTFYGGSRFG